MISAKRSAAALLFVLFKRSKRERKNSSPSNWLLDLQDDTISKLLCCDFGGKEKRVDCYTLFNQNKNQKNAATEKGGPYKEM